ncbi:hypothetical protein ACHAWF_015141 [Thalassiosira exigua]
MASSSSPPPPGSSSASAASAQQRQQQQQQSALASQLEERLIHQEYKIWKKNTPFLYDFVLTHGLEWPSLACQWLPVKKELNGGGGEKVGTTTVAGGGGNSGGASSPPAEQHELLMGTHTAGGERNYLMVASVNLPREDATIDHRTGKEEEEEEEGVSCGARFVIGPLGLGGIWGVDRRARS